MKEGIEQLKKEEEKSVMERLKALELTEKQKLKEDKAIGPWTHIKVEKLILANQELFELYDGKQIEPAKAKIQSVIEEIEKIRGKEEKEINKKFIDWIKPRIISSFSEETLKLEQEQDNTR